MKRLVESNLDFLFNLFRLLRRRCPRSGTGKAAKDIAKSVDIGRRRPVGRLTPLAVSAENLLKEVRKIAITAGRIRRAARSCLTPA